MASTAPAENHPQLRFIDKHLLMDDYHCYLIKIMIYNDNLINTVLIFLLNSYALWLFGCFSLRYTCPIYLQTGKVNEQSEVTWQCCVEFDVSFEVCLKKSWRESIS